MSIVSKFDDTFVIRGRKHPIKAVHRDAGEPYTPQYSFPPQVAWFNISKGIRKPMGLASLTGHTPGLVPLKSMQEGTHAGGMLLNAPYNTDIVPLKVPVYTATDMKQFETDEYTPQFPHYDYAGGIRPSVRPLREYPILEPTGPYPTRPQEVHFRQEHRLPYPVHYQMEDEIMRQVRNL